MLTAIAYCGKDIDSALRVLNWAAFMSHQNDDSLKKRSILIVASQSAAARRRHLEILQSAVESWGKVFVHVNPLDDERGWPSSPNAMFWAALTHAEKYFQDDLLWLEPDAIPLCEDWADVIESEFAIAKERGKTFMGAYVKHAVNHMTGVGVYGSNWRSVAPKLDNIVVNGAGIVEAWDTYCADEILPNAFITESLQHVFYCPIVTLGMLKENAVIFHQDKRSALLPMLDEVFYDSLCARDERFSYLGIEPFMGEIKFFHADNSNRVIKSQGYEFRFDGYDVFAGLWRGTYATKDEGEIIALRALVDNPSTAVTEIDQAAYEQLSKKNVTQPTTSTPYKQHPAYPAQIKQSPAVLVEDPSQLPDAPAPLGALPENLDGILRLGTVKEPNPSEEPKKLRRIRTGKIVKLEKP
jgi:hypothetical protein